MVWRLLKKQEGLMELHGISIGSLCIIFLIAVLLFGTKRLRNMGEDLAIALRNFTKSFYSAEDTKLSKKPKSESIEGDSHRQEKQN
jgi:sec-independent protein translocase protein TatA